MPLPLISLGFQPWLCVGFWSLVMVSGKKSLLSLLNFPSAAMIGKNAGRNARETRKAEKGLGKREKTFPTIPRSQTKQRKPCFKRNRLNKRFLTPPPPPMPRGQDRARMPVEESARERRGSMVLSLPRFSAACVGARGRNHAAEGFEGDTRRQV